MCCFILALFKLYKKMLILIFHYPWQKNNVFKKIIYIFYILQPKQLRNDTHFIGIKFVFNNRIFSNIPTRQGCNV